MEISILFGKLSILFFERKFWMKNKHQPENGEKNGDLHSFWEISNHFFKRKFQKFWMKNKNQRENGEKNGDLHSFWENLHFFLLSEIVDKSKNQPENGEKNGDLRSFGDFGNFGRKTRIIGRM